MTNNKKPVLLYDGDCSFCKYWILYWKQITGEKLLYIPYQEASHKFPEISLQELSHSIHLVSPDGGVLKTAEAVFTALALNPKKKWLLWAYKKVPGFATITEAVYKFASHHRGFSLRLSKLFWGKKPVYSDYSISRWLYLRILGIIYFIAFLSAAFQIIGLIGSDGILPITNIHNSINPEIGLSKFWLFPTLTWFSSSNSFLYLLTYGGAATALLVIFNMAVLPALIILWLFYLSVTTAGQTFFSFQWDILLLEMGFLALFLAPNFRLVQKTQSVVHFLHKWLLFKLVFLSGYLKMISGDSSWRDLTALTYHYSTQPLPTPLAWYVHQWPILFHKISTFGALTIEIIAPLMLFFPRRIRMIGASLIIALQLIIIITGNYTFFNLLTIALALLMFDSAFYTKILPQKLLRRLNFSKEKESSTLRKIVVGILAIIIFLSSLIQFDFLGGNNIPKFMNSFYRPISTLRIFNGYGLFVNMTKTRPEIIVEGSKNGENWQEYVFKYKPGNDLTKTLPWVAPHQPRLDWQMWFAALSNFQNTPWFEGFATRLLEGSPSVLKLLDSNPFPEEPPKFIRAVIYNYSYTDRKTRKKTSQIWQREMLGLYLPPASLNR